MIYSDKIISTLELLGAVDEMSRFPGPYVVSTWQVVNAFKLSDSGFAPEIAKVGFTVSSDSLPEALQEVLEREVFSDTPLIAPVAIGIMEDLTQNGTVRVLDSSDPIQVASQLLDLSLVRRLLSHSIC